MKNSDALLDRLIAASRRAIASNNIGVVGRDGRARIVLEHVHAQGSLANLLREIGEIPMHAKDCAARKSPIALCNCPAYAEQERTDDRRTR
jgi:hypothetical protein